jgi:hypothetical protein
MTAKRKTIGANPLDGVLPSAPEPAPVVQTRRTEPIPVTHAEGGRKVRATFHISADLLEEMRDAVVALSGPPVRLTLARLAEDALREHLESLKGAHNGGRPFPARDRNLQGGRPIGS